MFFHDLSTVNVPQLRPWDRDAPNVSHPARKLTVMSEIDLFASLGWRRSVVIVADASALLQDLRHSARGSVGILGELARLGFVISPPSVIFETEKHLAKMLAIDAPEPVLRRLWGEYKQSIRIVEVDPEEAHGVDVEMLRERDPRDVPVLAVAQALHSRAVILTSDLDFISLGLAPADWLTTARSVKEVADVDSTELVALMVLRGLAIGSAHLLRAANAGTISARLGLIGLAAALTWAVAERGRRTRIADGLTTIVGKYGDLLLVRADHTRRLGFLPSTSDLRQHG